MKFDLFNIRSLKIVCVQDLFRSNIKVELYFHNGIYINIHKKSTTKIYNNNTAAKLLDLTLIRDSFYQALIKEKSCLFREYIFYSILVKRSPKLRAKHIRRGYCK